MIAMSRDPELNRLEVVEKPGVSAKAERTRGT